MNLLCAGNTRITDTGALAPILWSRDSSTSTSKCRLDDVIRLHAAVQLTRIPLVLRITSWLSTRWQCPQGLSHL
jgi:hypothetical protein